MHHSSSRSCKTTRYEEFEAEKIVPSSSRLYFDLKVPRFPIYVPTFFFTGVVSQLRTNVERACNLFLFLDIQGGPELLVM